MGSEHKVTKDYPGKHREHGECSVTSMTPLYYNDTGSSFSRRSSPDSSADYLARPQEAATKKEGTGRHENTKAGKHENNSGFVSSLFRAFVVLRHDEQKKIFAKTMILHLCFTDCADSRSASVRVRLRFLRSGIRAVSGGRNAAFRVGVRSSLGLWLAAWACPVSVLPAASR